MDNMKSTLELGTKAQIEAAKAKSWTSYYVDGYTALLGDYYGCDADPIGVKLPEMETVNVNNTTQLTAIVSRNTRVRCFWYRRCKCR